MQGRGDDRLQRQELTPARRREPLAGDCSVPLPRFERFLALAELDLLLFFRFFYSDLQGSRVSTGKEN
jgi:hypothetical protein